MDAERMAAPAGPDERKSARMAERYARSSPGEFNVRDYQLGRHILRSPGMVQAGLGTNEVMVDDPAHAPVFFLDGEDHRRKRAAIARFFTPRAIHNHHRPVMEAMADELVGELRRRGRLRLDDAAWRLAVVVASEIVGLDDSRAPGMCRRLDAVLRQTDIYDMPPFRKLLASILARINVMIFYHKDVLPAIKRRRTMYEQDIISHLLAEGYSNKAILIECMTYATAGMATTREFITMAAWHLFDNDLLRQRFMSGDEAVQMAIIEEILRLEPVATFLRRRAEGQQPADGPAEIRHGTTYAIDLRAINTDEAVTGPNPHVLDPDRAARMKVGGPYMSFGDGSHRCPGAQVALTESRIFLDRLFRVPGLRMVKTPAIGWNSSLMSYELRGCVIACDRP